MRGPAHKGGGTGGFTLLELVLVMMIMCTVLALAAPSLRGFFASHQTQDAAACIVALAGFARSQAIAEGCVYRFNFDGDEGTYWLTVQREGGFEPLKTEFGRTFHLPEGTQLDFEARGGSRESTYVDFFPTGRTEPAAIRLTGRQGDTELVACLSATEQFRVTVGYEGEAIP